MSYLVTHISILQREKYIMGSDFWRKSGMAEFCSTWSIFRPGFFNSWSRLRRPLDQEFWFNHQSPKISTAGRILDLKSVSCNFEMARLENFFQIMLVKISVWYKFLKFSKLCGWPLTFYIKKLRNLISENDRLKILVSEIY